MFLQQTPPDSVMESLREKLGRAESVRLSAKSDLTCEQQFGITWLIVTDSHLAVADDGSVAETIPLDGIREIRVDEMFGGGCLTAVLAEGERRLVYYTKGLVPEFGVLSRLINDMKKGKPFEVPESEGETHCRRCGNPLPERGAACPKCVPRLSVLMRLLGFLNPHRGKMILVVLLTFVSVAARMGPPWFTKRIVDDVIVPKDLSSLAFWIVMTVLCTTVALGVRWIDGAISAWLASHLIADLRMRLHAHLQRLKLSYFHKREAGELVSRVMHDTQELQMFMIDGLPYLLVNTVMFFSIAAILLVMDWRLALIVFVPVPFMIFGVKWFWDRLHPLFHRHGSRRGKLHSILGESIRGVKSVKASTREDYRARQFDATNQDLRRTVWRIEFNWMGFMQGTMWIMQAGTALVWFFGARRIIGGGEGLTLGDLWAFVGYMVLFYMPMQWFTVVMNWMSHAFAGAERIFSVLDTQPEVYDSPDAIALPKIKGTIRLDDVHFSYERGKEVIRGINLDIAPGEMIGLVGRSGAGKSTIISLICRFYDVDSGAVLLDGHPIRKLKLADLRRQIGIVMQEPFLFRASIMENIRYGAADADFDAVVRAAQAAHAHEFIVDKEYGYDTIVGEGGATLSGGEKQRVAIARAILQDPPILILDEATSSVDSETEKAIQLAINNLVKDRTTIAIAHRLATLRNADRLVIVDDGRIIETGTHDELLKKEGLYAQLVRTQTELNRLRASVWQE